MQRGDIDGEQQNSAPWLSTGEIVSGDGRSLGQPWRCTKVLVLQPVVRFLISLLAWMSP